jgi:hypothetical protein
MMKNGVYKLKQNATLPNGMSFTRGTEFEIISGVLYMGGFPVDFRAQNTIVKWMQTNKHLFKNDTRNW